MSIPFIGYLDVSSYVIGSDILMYTVMLTLKCKFILFLMHSDYLSQIGLPRLL